MATTPIVWREAYTPTILQALVTADNSNGTIPSSDLELTCMLIAQKDVLVHAHNICKLTVWLDGDNGAAIAWLQKGSSTSEGSVRHPPHLTVYSLSAVRRTS
jgi:hypothetical protein